MIPPHGPWFEQSTEGISRWWLDGKLHRDDGPAIVGEDGFRAWLVHGKIHRVDGPAIIEADGTKWWWLNNEQLDPLVHFIKAGKIKHG